RVDLEEQVALLDVGPLLERDLVEIAADASADLDGLDRLGLAGELLEVGDLLDDGPGDDYLGRPRRRQRRRLLLTTRHDGDRPKYQQRQSTMEHRSPPFTAHFKMGTGSAGGGACRHF